MTEKSPFIPSDLLHEAIVDSSDDAIISKDLSSTIMSWNKAAERIFGYVADEMIGQSILKLLPLDRQDEEVSILNRLRRGERVDHFETKRQRKDGTLIDVSLTISPIRDAAGVIVGASKIARDITAQREVQRRLGETIEELKRASRMKAEFLATLSHELRTPLNAILGWVQLLKDDATPPELAEARTIIERNARAQSQLIEDLLDMSRIESGQMHLDIEQLDLVAVVSAGIKTVRPTATAKGLRLTSAFTSMTGMVMGDKNRIQQIVWNLLTNAIKFTPKGGRVHIVTKRVNSHAEICVSDSGMGIPPDFLPHVFDRFRQADPTTTRRHGGLGLGLSIVKQLTELHGGSVRVESEGAGKGATFTVSLPLHAVQPEEEEMNQTDRGTATDEPGSNKNNLRDTKVLVVDDDEDSVTILKRTLERHGAEVCATRSMAEALEAFARFSPDVVVSDIGMPEHDGYELISRLRALPEGRRVPAIALTALARGEDRARALQAGFQMHLPKPVEFKELIAVVENLAALAR